MSGYKYLRKWETRLAKIVQYSNTAHQITFVCECVSIRLHVAVLLSKDVDVIVTFTSVPVALIIAHLSGFWRRIHREIGPG